MSLAYDCRALSVIPYEFSSMTPPEIEIHDIFVFYQSNLLVSKTEILNHEHKNVLCLVVISYDQPPFMLIKFWEMGL